MANNQKQSITEQIESYAGQWVALKADQTSIIAHAKTLKSALKKAHQQGEKIPLLIQGPTTAFFQLLMLNI